MWHTNEDIHRGAENLLAHRRLAAHTPIVIVEEQVVPAYLVHSETQPFCSDMTCPCQAERDTLDILANMDEQAYYSRSQELAEHEQDEPEHPPDCACAWCLPDEHERYYSRAEQEADQANADYYDEAQRRNTTIQTKSGEWW